MNESYLDLLIENRIIFDLAVPQDWLDHITKLCGKYFLGWVWVYPKGSVFGEPCPRNEEARQILENLQEPYFDPRQLFTG